MDGLGRHNDRIFVDRQVDHNIRELSRPQAAIFILEGRLQLDRAGLGIDSVIDERQVALYRVGLSFGIGQDFQMPR